VRPWRWLGWCGCIRLGTDELSNPLLGLAAALFHPGPVLPIRSATSLNREKSTEEVVEGAERRSVRGVLFWPSSILRAPGTSGGAAG
jgi:hypothetical protein